MPRNRNETRNQLALPLDSPLRGKVKNDRNVMAYNFFRLTKESKPETISYNDGKVQISVGSEKLWASFAGAFGLDTSPTHRRSVGPGPDLQ